MGHFKIDPKKNGNAEENAALGCRKTDTMSGRIRPACLFRIKSGVGPVLRS